MITIFVGRQEWNAAKAFGGRIAEQDKRKIISCSNAERWYKDKIGEVITVRCYGSFGCYDTEDRWISFYDLSGIIK